MMGKRVWSTILLCGFGANVAAADLAGNYRVEGENPDGSPYRGSLAVSLLGDAWRFEWQAGGSSSGTGMQLDAAVAVAVGGAECSVVIYRIEPDGRLHGVWTAPGGGVAGSESAVPGLDAPAGLAGDYLVEGRNPNGSAYKGALGIVAEGEHWRLSWRTGTNFEGYGLERDGYLGVSWGSPACGVVLYRLGTAGALDGRWKYYRTGIGRERATRD